MRGPLNAHRSRDRPPAHPELDTPSVDWVDRRQRAKQSCVSVTAERDAEGLLTVREAGGWLGGARSTMYVLMRKGLPYVQVGRIRRIDIEDLRAYVEAQRVEWVARIRR